MRHQSNLWEFCHKLRLNLRMRFLTVNALLDGLCQFLHSDNPKFSSCQRCSCCHSSMVCIMCFFGDQIRNVMVLWKKNWMFRIICDYCLIYSSANSYFFFIRKGTKHVKLFLLNAFMQFSLCCLDPDRCNSSTVNGLSFSGFRFDRRLCT